MPWPVATDDVASLQLRKQSDLSFHHAKPAVQLAILPPKVVCPSASSSVCNNGLRVKNRLRMCRSVDAATSDDSISGFQFRYDIFDILK